MSEDSGRTRDGDILFLVCMLLTLISTIMNNCSNTLNMKDEGMEVFVNLCWVESVERVSKMWSVLDYLLSKIWGSIF